MFKSFVIILKDHESSERYGNACLDSGKLHGWDVERFDAVDGRTLTLSDLSKYGLFVNQGRNKVSKQFKRPGVLGCFLSHYTLWNKCIELNEPIGIFEQDSIMLDSPPTNLDFDDLLKLYGFDKMPREAAGEWYVYANAYIIKPAGARKLIDWIKTHGILPADIQLGEDIITIDKDLDNRVSMNLESIEKSTTRFETF